MNNVMSTVMSLRAKAESKRGADERDFVSDSSWNLLKTRRENILPTIPHKHRMPVTPTERLNRYISQLLSIDSESLVALYSLVKLSFVLSVVKLFPTSAAGVVISSKPVMYAVVNMDMDSVELSIVCLDFTNSEYSPAGDHAAIVLSVVLQTVPIVMDSKGEKNLYQFNYRLYVIEYRIALRDGVNMDFTI